MSAAAQPAPIGSREPEYRPRIPEELTRQPLKRLGEGIGKIVYASEHWVVKRERSPFEVAALIVLWRNLKRLDRVVPGRIGQWLMEGPSRKLRVLRVATQGVMLVVPKTIWFKSHIRRVWHGYHARNLRGERLAEERLAGSSLIPATIAFPPARVRVGGWPGFLTVSEATERVETTLFQHLTGLANQRRFAEIELWLDRLLAARQAGWRLGLFSTDAHLKNFGIIGDRVVLIDTGGLTDRWADIEARLDLEEVVSQPHIRLGLGAVLGSHPEIAERFDGRWRAVVNRDAIRTIWPDGRDR